MKKSHEDALNEALDGTLNVWVMARVLREHAHSTTVSQGHDDLNDRELLTAKLVQKFPGHVTEKVICIIFGIYFAQAGEIVKRLEKLDLVQRTGRGKPLELTKNGRKTLLEVQRIQARRFAFFCAELDTEDLRIMAQLMDKILKTTTRLVQERIFGMPPATARLFSKE